MRRLVDNNNYKVQYISYWCHNIIQRTICLYYINIDVYNLCLGQSFIVTCSSATWYFILPVAELLSLYGDLQYNTAITVQDM